MRNIFSFLFVAIAVAIVNAQPALMKAGAIIQYIDKLPVNPAVAIEANDKRILAMKRQEELQSQIDVLVERAGHKSRILSMLSKKYDYESDRYDFSKIIIKKDKELDERMQEVNTAFFYEWDTYTRNAGTDPDSARKYFPVLAGKVKQQLQELVIYMDKRNLDAVVDNSEASNPYYQQLLEIRGIMIDRVMKLNQLTEQ